MRKDSQIDDFEEILKYISQFGILEYLSRFHTPHTEWPTIGDEIGKHIKKIRGILKRIFPKMENKISVWESLHGYEITKKQKLPPDWGFNPRNKEEKKLIDKIRKKNE
jgi:hypothetical protein